MAFALAPPAVSAARLDPPSMAIQKAHHDLLQAWMHGGKGGEALSMEQPETQAMTCQAWDLLGRWASTYLDEHPKAHASDLARSFDPLVPQEGTGPQFWKTLEVSALALERHTFVVTASYLVGDGAAGNFFVVTAGPDGRQKVAWNVLDIAKAHFERKDELGRWAYLSDTHYYNGSLTGTPYPLSRAANGHPRFYVQAYQHAHGGTFLPQVSLWEWDGLGAKPLLQHSYLQSGDDDFGRKFDGKLLRFGTKESSDTFVSLGGAEEPRGIWTVQVTPQGVKDLGHRWREPNAQLVDQLFTRLRKGEKAQDLASPAAIAWIRERFAPEPGGGEDKDPGYFLGMYDSSRTTRARGLECFHLSSDRADLTFTIIRRKGKACILACNGTVY